MLGVCLVIASVLFATIISWGALACVREYFRGKEHLLSKLQEAADASTAAVGTAVSSLTREVRKGYN